MMIIVTHTDGSHGSRVFTGICLVCLSVYPHDISKINAARITKHDVETYMMILETHLFRDQKIQGQGQKSQKQCWHGSLHSCGYWLLLVSCVLLS